MISNNDWKPSFAWHARFLGVMLAVCLMVFTVCCYVAAHLPAPYQPHRPALQATPWQHHSVEDL